MDRAFEPKHMPPFMKKGGKVRRGNPLYWTFVFITAILTPILFRVKVEGRWKLPRDTGYILTPNHDNAFDPIIMSYYHIRWGKPIHWLGKIELFRPWQVRSLEIPQWFTTWFCYTVLIIPIIRGSVQNIRETLTGIQNVLAQNGCVGVFPEGTRNKERQNQYFEIHSGAIKFAMSNNVPLVPVAVKSSKPRLGKRGNYKLVHGAPQYFKKGEEINLAVERLRAAMAELGGFE